jgi:TonB dependent receptor
VTVAAAANELRTDSLFVNDSWDAGRHWSFSLGARYDRNHSADADGTVNSGDGRVVPRLSVQYDLSGDGRRRVTASFSEYSSRIADNIASSNQVAGNAAQIDFAYKGPGINAMALTVPLQDVLRNVFQYFNTMQGGTANTTAANLRASGNRTVPGYATYFDGSLAAPYVREVTVGYGSQLGAGGYARVDLIHRDWRDLYGSSVTSATRRTTTPFGIPADLTLVHNSSSARRNYNGVQLQARWNASRFDAGTHYTYSKLRGNDEEIAAGGAVANPEPGAYYPEFIGYDRNAPAGYLAGDQRHRLRAWAGYEIPMRAQAGSLHVSLLQNYDSALSYSAVAPINVTAYAGAPASTYSSVPNGQYYLSGRGELRVDNISSTDLALRYSRRFAGLELFAQGDLLNALNRHGVADPRQISTAIGTAATSATFVPFNPFTATPIECPMGAEAKTCRDMEANFQRAANFGQPLSDLAYQRPRMYRFSFGVRY